MDLQNILATAIETDGVWTIVGVLLAIAIVIWIVRAVTR